MKFNEVVKKHPDILTDPGYNPDEYPRMFENSLEAVVKANGLSMERSNRDDVYDTDFRIFRVSNNETLFYGDAEYDNSGKLFKSDGKISYFEVNIPIEKFERFKKKFSDKDFVYVKGSKDLKYVMVLRGDAIIKHSKPKSKESNHNGVKAKRDFMCIHTYSMIQRNHLLSGGLQEWLLMVKKLFPMWKWWGEEDEKTD